MTSPKQENIQLGELRTVIGSVINMQDVDDIELAIQMLRNLLLKVRAGRIVLKGATN